MDEEKMNELPFESQMRLQTSFRNAQALVQHLEEGSERDKKFDVFIEFARNCKDVNMLTTVLFLGSEYFEKLKDLPAGVGMEKMRAMVLDWLRHVGSEDISLVEKAIEAYEACVGGCYEKAEALFGEIRLYEEEFKAIEEYWRESLEWF